MTNNALEEQLAEQRMMQDFEQSLHALILDKLPVTHPFASRKAFDFTLDIARVYELSYYATRERKDGYETLSFALACLRQQKRRWWQRPRTRPVIDKRTARALDEFLPQILAATRALGVIPHITYEDHPERLREILAAGREATQAADDLGVYLNELFEEAHRE